MQEAAGVPLNPGFSKQKEILCNAAMASSTAALTARRHGVSTGC